MPIADTNVVGDLFWANMAAEQVYDSFNKRKAAVESLQKLIQWSFGLFTVGGVVASFFSTREQYSLLALGILGAGYAILVIAYYFTTRAAFPVAMEMRPNQPDNISAAFTEALLINTRRFEIASAVTLIGFSFLAIGILIQFVGPPKKEKNEKKEATLSFH